MQDVDLAIAELGNEPPLVADGRSGPPDRREVSARWLSGTFLTGLTSSVLMGVALFAALDGREQLATPPEIADLLAMQKPDDDDKATKTSRVVQPRQIVRAKDRRRLEVSVTTKSGDQEVVRKMPVMQVKMSLAAGYDTNRAYPAFDAARIAEEDIDDAPAPAKTAVEPDPAISEQSADTDMLLKTVDFPIATAAFDERSQMTADEVEEVVRSTAPILTDGDVQVAALHFVDPQRFGASMAAAPLGYEIKITQENVSVSPRAVSDTNEVVFAEDIIPFVNDKRIDAALQDAGYDEAESAAFAARIAGLLNGRALRAGSVLRVGLEVRDETPKIVRVSVYSGTRHALTVALRDGGGIDPGDEPPEENPELASAFDDSPPVPSRGSMPTVYDGIYRAAFSNGMSRNSVKRLVKLLSPNVEMQTKVRPSDKLEVLFSQPDDDDKMSDESSLLYVSATFGGTIRKFYRHQFADGSIDYFDANGRNTRQSFLRKAVPSGVFRSGFGGRRHPILRYVKMHTGVDWSAPSGTPIIAVADGVVEKAGWAGGYGKQTILRHQNGYETSYNHQSRMAPKIRPGAKVRQGQVIGYVGTTGLSTGAHLHFEVIVNGTKVDPMRVRLPAGFALSGKELTAFKRERQRIDNLLKEDDPLKMASAKP